ncbi:phage holin family protein [Nitratidesulfovibrio vulgaris]|nr:phage holin family protein [Nitratidesulfovibrio vulgaris]
MMLDQLALWCGIQCRELTENSVFKSALAAVFAWVAGMLGGVANVLPFLAILLVLDYVLGFVRACRIRRISGAKMRAGAWKFLFYFAAVFVVATVDGALGKAWTLFHVPMGAFFVFYLCVNEAMSCLDHLKFFGVPIPEWLSTRLRDYRETFCPPAGRAASGTK